jgi:hypothetical protein
LPFCIIIQRWYMLQNVLQFRGTCLTVGVKCFRGAKNSTENTTTSVHKRIHAYFDKVETSFCGVVFSVLSFGRFTCWESPTEVASKFCHGTSKKKLNMCLPIDVTFLSRNELSSARQASGQSKARYPH